VANSHSVHSKWAASQDGEARAAYAEQIGKRLKATRRALNLTQAELCRSSGVQPSTYNQYERGINVISLSQALRLCDAFAVTLDWIYRGDPTSLPARVMRVLAAQARC
jgi:transcriptional regulator with XRE-family HTH domain